MRGALWHRWREVALSESHPGCPFCELAPSRVVAQSLLTITIRDAFPVSPGHTLVIPRRDFAILFDATPEEICEIWQAL